MTGAGLCNLFPPYSRGLCLPVREYHLCSKVGLHQELRLTRTGRRPAPPAAVCVRQPGLQTGAAALGPHAPSWESSDLRGRKSDSCDFRRATWSFMGRDGVCSCLLWVKGSMRRDPILKHCPSLGTQHPWQKPKHNAWAREESPSPWQVLPGLQLRGVAFGAWKVRGAGRARWLCPVSTGTHNYRTPELEAGWMVIPSLIVFPKGSFLKTRRRILCDEEKEVGAGKGKGASFKPPAALALQKSPPNQNVFILTSIPGDSGSLFPCGDHGRCVMKAARDGTVFLLRPQPH